MAPIALPIDAYADTIRDALRSHQVVIVAGDTGSGKTTRIPRFCLDIGRGRDAMVGCTQPRRIAATSVAERVANELGCPVGGLVGWQHRFGKSLSDRTRVKFMTDGILLAETRADPDLRRYDTVMIDEAHERTLNIDFLLGYLRQRLRRRPDLKVVVSSATMDVARFSEFFGKAPVLEIPGRVFPVEVRYAPPDDDEEDLPRRVANGVEELVAERPGDILVFLPGERDIRASMEVLRGRNIPDLEVLPLMASLPPQEQRRVFQPDPGGRRRVVLSTNVAETSLTIPGIRMVVDSGLARINRFSHKTQIQRLHIEPISQASAEQRKGRCGRLGPGVCLRLYEEADFRRRDAYTEPELRRSSLAGVILTMEDLRLGRIEDFPFLDPPSPSMIREGYRELQELAAVDETGRLTRLGRHLARFPLEPRFARMLLAARDAGVLEDALVVVAALACENPLLRPMDKLDEAARAHAKFATERSDFAGLLLLWRWFHDPANAPSRTAARKLCATNYISFRRMEEWEDVHNQLARLMNQPRASEDAPTAAPLGKASPREAADAPLHRALLTGLLSHLGQKDPEKQDYRGCRSLRFAIHPGSGLFKKQPEWCMAAELVDTTRLYARRVAAIDPEWIEPAAKHLCKSAYHSPYWDGAAGTARALERVTLYGLVLADGRRRDLSRIDPDMSRVLFIRHGLVEGEFPRPVPEPVRTSLARIRAQRDLAGKTRGQVAFDEDALCEEWRRRLPPGLCNVAELRRWIARATPEELAALEIPESFFATPEALRDAHPPRIRLLGRALPLAYRHDTDAEDDGITCTFPVEALPAVLLWHSDWLVPGALPAKIDWILRHGFTRAEVRQLAEAAHCFPADALADRLFEALPLPPATSLAKALDAAYRAIAQRPPPRSFETLDLDGMPPHFLMRFRIVDGSGRELFATRSTAELREFRDTFERLSGSPLPQPSPLCGTVQDTATIPKSVPLGKAGWDLVAFPALAVQSGQHVCRLFAAEAAATRAHRDGVLTAARGMLGRHFGTLGGAGIAPRDVKEACSTFGQDPEALHADCALAAIEATLLPEGADAPRQIRALRQTLEAMLPETGRLAREQYQLAGAALVLAAGLEREVRRTPLHEAIVGDILTEQLPWLVYPGFARETPPSRLRHFGRYLEALRLRIERARQNPERDLQRLGQITPLWTRYKALALSPRTATSPLLPPIRWAVEELRVSLFAQELKTPEPVSAVRITRMLDGMA